MLRGWLVPIALFLGAAIAAAPIWPYNHDGMLAITAWILTMVFLMVVAGIFVVAYLEHM
jgi:hypothetical protein